MHERLPQSDHAGVLHAQRQAARLSQAVHKLHESAQVGDHVRQVQEEAGQVGRSAASVQAAEGHRDQAGLSYQGEP